MFIECITQVFSSSISMEFLNPNPLLSKKICLISFIGIIDLTLQFLKVQLQVPGVIINIGGVVFSSTDSLDR